MQTKQEIHNLLIDLIDDLDKSAIQWQLAALVACLVLAWIVTRAIRSQFTAPHTGALRVGLGGANRVVFPLTALVLVVAAKTMLQHWQHVSALNVAVPLLASLALVQLAVYVLRHIFAPSGWLHSFERVIAIVVWSGVALHITGFLPEILQAMEDLSFHAGKYRISLYTVVNGAVSVGATLLVVLWLISALEKRLMAADGLSMSLRVVLAKVMRALLLFIGLLIALPLAGIDITVLSVFGGALGVGVGFGLQKIASNYISGFIILLDGSIRIGDLVTIDSRYGTVTAITARHVVVKMLDGTEAIIPNETLITSTVLNHSYTNRQQRISIPTQVAYGPSLEKAAEIMLDTAHQHPRVLATPAAKVFLKEFGDNGIDLELSVWIDDPEDTQVDLRSELNWAIWRRFQAEGIEIPYPQRVVTLLKPG